MKKLIIDKNYKGIKEVDGKKISCPTVKLEEHPQKDFLEVELFLRVKGRLPTQEGDRITHKIIQEFEEKYKKGEIKQGLVPLNDIQKAIDRGILVCECDGCLENFSETMANILSKKESLSNE